ncbi:MAG TPA: DUF998 domain-containing protein [Ornithinicoccus sp.]|nr:DUF998 domain-containing protein [Ornithinicoccus sp.]
MPHTTRTSREGFDRAAAVTRSMLGWGVVAGPFYLVVGLALALCTDGFDLGEHALSLLMLGDHGWIQSVNLVLTGLMVLVAAKGFERAAAGSGRGRHLSVPLGIYGLCLAASGLVPPDPVQGFPPGSAGGEASVTGLLHLAFGGVGFLAGAALATSGTGVLALWLAVVVGLAWLLGASVHAYRTVPHPDLHRRERA